MKRSLLLLGFAALIGLSGCAYYDVERIKTATAEGGTPFTKALTDEYRTYANFEATKEYEWNDAAIFARKGLRTAKGEVVPPEEVAAWSLPAGRVGELTDARRRLVTALDGGARDRVPAPAAKAQAMFDCWIEEEAEGDATSNCRAEFLKTEPLLQVAQAAPAPAPAAAKSYVIYFDFDKSTLTPEGRQIVDRMVADLKAGAAAKVQLVGKADRAGSDAYNQKLSERRAKTVSDALVKAGITSDRIASRAVGEKEPPVPTPDGVREPRNRVVEVSIR